MKRDSATHKDNLFPGMGRYFTFVCLRCDYREEIDLLVGGLGECPNCDTESNCGYPSGPESVRGDTIQANGDSSVPFVVEGGKLVLNHKYVRPEEG